MLTRLRCALFGHDVDLVMWFLATSRAMPQQRTMILRECRRCSDFVNTGG